MELRNDTYINVASSVYLLDDIKNFQFKKGQ